MNKPAQIISILILSASVGMFAGCGKQETTNPSPSTNETMPSAASESTVKEGLGESSAQHSLDEIKWNEVKDPLIKGDMITKLKAAIAAFVSNDLDQFHAALAPSVGTAHDYLFEHPVKFIDISEAVKEKERILVPVVGKRLTKEKGFSSDVGYTFYFEKDKNGSWQIVSID